MHNWEQSRRLDLLLQDSDDLRRLVHSPVFSADDQLKALTAVLDKAGVTGLAASFLKLVCVELDVSPRLIRGFSTNIANYNLLGEPCPKDAFIEMMTAGRWCNQVAINHTCCSASNVRQLDLHSSCASHLATRFTSGSLQTRPKVLLGPIGACLRADVIEAR